MSSGSSLLFLYTKLQERTDNAAILAVEILGLFLLTFKLRGETSVRGNVNHKQWFILIQEIVELTDKMLVMVFSYRSSMIWTIFNDLQKAKE